MEDHVNGERAYPERRRFARRPAVRLRRGEPARPSARTGGLRLDAGAGRGFPGIRIRTAGRLWMAVAAIPARPTCDRSHDSTRLDSPRRRHALMVTRRDLPAVDAHVGSARTAGALSYLAQERRSFLTILPGPNDADLRRGGCAKDES